MADAELPGSHPEITSNTYRLTVWGCPDGRLALAGLPDDREARLTLVTSLQGVLAAIQYADTTGASGLSRQQPRPAGGSRVAGPDHRPGAPCGALSPRER